MIYIIEVSQYTNIGGIIMSVENIRRVWGLYRVIHQA